MLHQNAVHNGRLLPLEEVRLSPGQAGLMSGWGLFTTLRIIDGVPFAFERHWRRLQKDAKRTHLPMAFEASNVQAQLDELLRANQVREGTARIYIVYNKVGFWQGAEEMPPVDLILCTAGLPPHHEPARLGLREHGRHAASPLAGVKTTAWLNNVWNLYEAQQAGWDEVLLLNERGEVAECTTANFFCVRRGKVLTPPLSSGCLEGVTRGLLLEMAPRAGVPMEETTLKLDDVYAADEIFISSTNRNLLAVGEVADHKFAAAPGPVTRKLDQAFTGYITEYLSRHAAASGRAK